METRLLVAGLAVAFMFACTFAASLLAWMVLRRRRVVMAAQGERPGIAGLLAWRLRNGFPVMAPLAHTALKVKPASHLVDEAVSLCASHGFSTERQSMASVLIATVISVSLAVGVATASPVGLLASAACLVAVLFTLAGNVRDKREDAVHDAIPGALESMSACFGSGFTLLQTFNQVAAETSGPLGETFARSAHVLEMGGSAERALAELREGAHASELAFVAVALDVQHQSGGAMRQVLDAAADSVKGELALRRSLRVQTAQAKLSARVVVVMPFVLIAAFSLASPDFLMPFFSSALGYALLALALVMQVAGIVLVRRALEVEGVS